MPATGAKPLKLAVIGTGRWGQVLIDNISAAPDLDLVAVVTTKGSGPGKLDEPTPVCAAWQEAAMLAKPDGFVLAVPPDRQPALASELIAEGHPLFLEKPLARSVADAEALLSLGEAVGFVGVVDHLHLLAPEFQALARRAGTDGPIEAIRAVSGNRGPYRAGWPVLWDWAPHDISMVLTLTRRLPASVSARIADRREIDGRVHENIHLSLSFADHGPVELETGNAFDGRRRTFRATTGVETLIYNEDADNRRSFSVERDGEKTVIEVPSVPPLTAALSLFSARVGSRESGLNDLRLGVDVVRIIAAAEQSLGQGGEPVALSS